MSSIWEWKKEFDCSKYNLSNFNTPSIPNCKRREMFLDYAKNCYPKEPVLTLKSKYTVPPIHKISVSKKFDKVALSRFITAWPEAPIVFIVIKRINSEKVFEAYCPMCANSCFYGSAVLNYFLDWIENKVLKFSPNWVEVGLIGCAMSLFQKLVNKTQISKPSETAMDHNSIILMILLPFIAI